MDLIFVANYLPDKTARKRRRSGYRFLHLFRVYLGRKRKI